MLPDRIGRYELRGVAGSGGFATVFEGYDPRLDARVAIKVLADNWSRDPEIRRRFRHEAVLLRRLRTDKGVPGLVEVFDVDETEGGQPFFVMGWADRGTLAQRAGQRAWDPAEVVPVIRAMTQCLGHLHAAGVVHRDIKPQNLLLRSDRDIDNDSLSLVANGERLLIGDLGLAKDLTLESSALSLLGGTPTYMAPEQRVLGASVDHRADIYAATILVAELLGGPDGAQKPSPELAQVLAIGTAEDPNERYATTTQWQEALLAVLAPVDTAPVNPAAVNSAAVNPAPVNPAAANPAAATQPGPRGSRGGSTRGRIVATIAVAAALVLVAVLLMRGSDVAIIGPSVIESGETASYRLGGDSRSTIVWTDPSGGTVAADTLEVTGRLPGQLTIAATRDDETISRSVVVERSPDGPSIIGPDSVGRGETGTYIASVPVGQTFHWLHPTRGEVFSNTLEVTQDGSSFVVGLISVDAAGVERGDQLLVTGG